MAFKMPFFIKMRYKITPLGTARFCTYKTVLTLVLPYEKQNQGLVETASSRLCLAQKQLVATTLWLAVNY